MTQRMLIATGTGYESCTAFDGYTVIASPLPGYAAAEREARVFRRGSGNATCYGAYVLALARGSKFDTGLYLLVQHGGGREVWRVPTFYDGGEYERALLKMPERLQYAALFTLYRMASDSRSEGVDGTRAMYQTAFVEGRLKKSRKKKGYVRVTIEPRVLPPADTQHV